METFCGECFFCRNGFVNNCTNENGGWALGCRIDGGQAEYVRVPYADQGLSRIPDVQIRKLSLQEMFSQQAIGLRIFRRSAKRIQLSFLVVDLPEYVRSYV